MSESLQDRAGLSSPESDGVVEVAAATDEVVRQARRPPGTCASCRFMVPRDDVPATAAVDLALDHVGACAALPVWTGVAADHGCWCWRAPLEARFMEGAR